MSKKLTKKQAKKFWKKVFPKCDKCGSLDMKDSFDIKKGINSFKSSDIEFGNVRCFLTAKKDFALCSKCLRDLVHDIGNEKRKSETF